MLLLPAPGVCGLIWRSCLRRNADDVVRDEDVPVRAEGSAID